MAVDTEDTVARLPSAIVGSIINYVIREYCRKREARFAETSDTFATVAQTRDYALPARWSKPGQLFYFSTTGQKITLSLLLKQDFDEKYPGSVVYSTGGPYTVAGLDTSLILGDPTVYTIWNDKILLAKVPNRVITIFRYYWRIPADLVNNGDTNSMTEAAEQYIIFKSLEASSLFGIEDERMPIWRAAAKELEMNLDSEDSRRWVTGRTSQSTEPG